MNRETVLHVLNHPAFQKNACEKAYLGWSFSAVIFVMYVAYIWFLGAAPEYFARPLFDGQVTTWGVVIGLFVIVFSVLLTGVYVYLANGRFEVATRQIVEQVGGKHE